MSDIYWSYACLNALKSNHFGMFEYGLIHIADEMRKIKLVEIKDKVMSKDDNVLRILDSVRSMPVVIA